MANRFAAGLRLMLKAMTFPRTSNFTAFKMPGSHIDFRRAIEGGDSNAAVMACVRWASRTFPEAPPMLRRMNDQREAEPVFEHAFLDLLDRPNPYYSGAQLWKATIAQFVLNGNAYWRKIRSAAGRTVELWWIPNGIIEPKWPHTGSEFITHYDYFPNGFPERLEVEDVVHFRDGMDPQNMRKGLSPLASIFREVFTDDEASNYTAALLRNMGVPGVVISPGNDATSLSGDAEALKAQFKERFGGDSRGEPIVMSGPTKIETFGFHPEQMNLRELRKLPEERITAVMGIPAIVVGLGAGLDRSTFANMAEAREMAYESFLIPNQRLIAADMKTQLLPDFEGDTKRLRVGFDLSEVRVLQEDRDKLAIRANTMVNGGWVKVSEGRSMMGLPIDQEHEVYLRPFSTISVPAGELDIPAGQGRDDLSLAFHDPRLLALKAAPDLPDPVERAEEGMRRGWRARFAKELRALNAFLGRSRNVDNYDWDWHEKYAAEVQLEIGEVAMLSMTAADPRLPLDQVQRIAVGYAQERGAQLLRLDGDVSMAAATREHVRDLVAEAVDAGDSLRKLQGDLRTDLSFSAARAENVARTETATALGQGAKRAAVQQGREEKHWLTQGLTDPKVDAECAANERQGWIPMAMSFASGHDTIPAHPQCRCVVEYRSKPVSDLNPEDGLQEDVDAAIAEARSANGHVEIGQGRVETRCRQCKKLLDARPHPGDRIVVKMPGAALWCPRCKDHVATVVQARQEVTA
ncbi:portal protein [uncultured Mediterranean phage]|nr:portal protein [uncultured Mediterranean phage]